MNKTTLGLQDALKLMRLGRPLMVMSDRQSPSGKSFYVVPGGYVDPKNAEKIIARDDVLSCEDGLFPGCGQSWKMSSFVGAA